MNRNVSNDELAKTRAYRPPRHHDKEKETKDTTTSSKLGVVPTTTTSSSSSQPTTNRHTNDENRNSTKTTTVINPNNNDDDDNNTSSNNNNTMMTERAYRPSRQSQIFNKSNMDTMNKSINVVQHHGDDDIDDNVANTTPYSSTDAVTTTFDGNAVAADTGSPPSTDGGVATSVGPKMGISNDSIMKRRSTAKERIVKRRGAAANRPEPTTGNDPNGTNYGSNVVTAYNHTEDEVMPGAHHVHGSGVDGTASPGGYSSMVVNNAEQQHPPEENLLDTPIEAVRVEDDDSPSGSQKEERMIVEAVHVTPGRLENKWYRLGLGCVALLLVTGLVVAIVLGVGNSGPTESTISPTMSPTTMSPTSDRLDYLESLFTALYESNDLYDDNGLPVPYRRALEWIALLDRQELPIEIYSPDTFGELYRTDYGNNPLAPEQTNFVERFALVTIYFSTGGSSWTKGDGWLLPTSHCTWYGVNCTIFPGQDGKDVEAVTMLQLGQNELEGMLPMEVSLLKQLKHLGLEENALRGSIPAVMGNLRELEFLGLSYNGLSGSIPVELASLLQLKHLHLRQNELSKMIPAAMGNLTKLESLLLDRNNLSGSVPSEFSALQQMKDMLLYGNELTGTIPSELFHLTNLHVLRLGDNLIDGGIPTEIGMVTKLTYLDLSHRDLRYTELSKPNPNYTIPTEIGHLTMLQFLDLSSRELMGMWPPAMSNLAALTHLNLYCNHLSSALPAHLGRFVNLKHLDLERNVFTGTLSTEIGLLHHLTSLSVGRNELNGTLPTKLGQLTHLGLLRLWRNGFTGTLPTQLGLLQGLTRLSAATNQLNGALPTELGQLAQLTYLSLEENLFTGTLPSELGLSHNLQWLQANENQLHGTLPTELGQLTGLMWAYLCCNNFTGTVPAEYASLTLFTHFGIHNNSIVGSLNNTLCKVSFAGGTADCDEIECPCCIDKDDGECFRD